MCYSAPKVTKIARYVANAPRVSIIARRKRPGYGYSSSKASMFNTIKGRRISESNSIQGSLYKGKKAIKQINQINGSNYKFAYVAKQMESRGYPIYTINYMDRKNYGKGRYK